MKKSSIKISPLAGLLFIQLLLLLQAKQNVQCSSYLDDYFLPTAKLALHKIQQSLGPAANQESPATGANQAAPLLDEARKTSQEPNKSEFIKLDVAPDLLARAAAAVDQSVVTEAATTQPTTSSQPTSELVISESTSTQAPSTSTTEQTTISADFTTLDSSPAATQTDAPAQEQPKEQLESKSAEEAAKETELAAVAAVDASISFGDMFAGLSDSCYDEYGNARYCEPEFENAAYERQVEVSSECGRPPSRFCTAHLNERNEQVRNCHICDAQHPKKRHPASYLTDINNSNSPTCWVSAPISAALMNSSGVQASLIDRPADNVTLLLNLGKSYEITYISMQFCSLKPDSLAIFKSTDFGASYTPYQFYSSQCNRMYNRPSRASSAANSLEPTCLNSSVPAGAASSHNAARIAFLTHEGRGGAAGNQDKSQALQDWITATNIKIVLDRHQAAWVHSSLVGHNHAHRPESTVPPTQSQAANRTDEMENSLTNPSDTFNYAMSDLTVGGRCKCNGHASRCIHTKDGRGLQCDCRHNTAGVDCERCAAFHHDRPWARASQQDANPCQPCNCNGHSRKCVFDSELYLLSGKRSGGVCLKCRDNTDGRYCHYCKEGYTRDHSKPMSDKEACKPCDCHPLGSMGSACNQTTGQCPCKEGVAGLQCSRCAPGYQQSSSPTEPCIKLPENDINYEPSLVSVAGNEPDNQQQQQQPQNNLDNAQTRNNLNPVNGNENDLNLEGLGNNNLHDKQDDYSMPNELLTSNTNRHRMQRPQQHWPPKHAYYRGYHERGPQYTGLSEPDVDEELADRRLYVAPSYNSFGPTRYNSGNYWKRARGGRPNNIDMMPPVASLASEDLNSLDENGNINYATNVMYEDNFNQIHSSRRQQPTRGRHANGARSQQAIRFNDLADEQPMINSENRAVSCGDCQSATRKLSTRQFCHLDFAIKASVLSREMAEDWTRFEVEIQDIFKSPTKTSALLNGRSALQASSTGYLVDNNSLQQAENNNNNFNSTNSNVRLADETKAPIILGHRIKIGSVQSIWIPTEDLACKCPRLKIGSTYLIMGTMDAKENSVNSLQLDRHGVAIEWKSGLQEKLLKAQSRQSRGKC